MKELKKSYITPNIKETLEKNWLSKFSVYEVALNIGVSVSTLRYFLLGQGVKETTYDKIMKFLEVQKVRIK